MSSVKSFRPFKLPRVVPGVEHTKSAENKAFCLSDLAKSGLSPEDLCAQFDDEIVLPEKATAGYIIPYWDTDGRALTYADQELSMYRVRVRYPEHIEGARYTQPSGPTLNARGLPSSIPYIHPFMLQLPAQELICAEGEKKTVSILKHLGRAAFGIGGCQMWRDPLDKRRLHPWIVKILEKTGAKKLIIVPDGDILRYDICTSYSAFALAVSDLGLDVELLHPPGKIDDLIVRDGPAAWDSIPRVPLKGLIVNPANIVDRYGLAFKMSAQGFPVVHQNTSNVTKLLSQMPQFEPFWRNLDTGHVMMGEESFSFDQTDMELANYFQHNLMMDKVTHDKIRACITAIAGRNSRSPFFEEIAGYEWDGIPRLETWMVRHWGAPDTAHVRQVSKKWLVASCARMASPGTKIDWMLIVQGAQGVGKTWMPSVFFGKLAKLVMGEQALKDLQMLIHSGLVLGFDELDSFGRRETSELLALITAENDDFRPPYAHDVKPHPRRCLFYGSCNKTAFLQHNPDGYRRFAIVPVPRKLDFAALEAERNQLWAEGWYRFQHESMNYWEIDGASEIAQDFAIPNVLEDQVIQWVQGQIRSKQNPLVDGQLEFTLPQLLIGISSEREGRNPYFMRDVHGIIKALGGHLIARTDKTTRRYTIDPTRFG